MHLLRQELAQREAQHHDGFREPDAGRRSKPAEIRRVRVEFQHRQVVGFIPGTQARGNSIPIVHDFQFRALARDVLVGENETVSVDDNAGTRRRSAFLFFFLTFVRFPRARRTDDPSCIAACFAPVQFPVNDVFFFP